VTKTVLITGDTTREIAARLHPGQLVVLESTTYPGTTDEEVRPLLEETGLRTGAGARNNFFLAFSPEREDPGNRRSSPAHTSGCAGYGPRHFASRDS
jgi:UDP-N-acetyl-D-glucosamine dehydrogenase